MATSDPNDFTAVPDEILRPWAQAPELDEQVNQSRIKLGGILQSINPQGGFEGASEIDHVPDVLKEFEELVANDHDWIGYDEDDIDEEGMTPADLAAYNATAKELQEGGGEYEDEETMFNDAMVTELMDDLNILAAANDDSFNPNFRSMVIQSGMTQSLANRPKRPFGKSKSLKSAKFVSNFGCPPLHKIQEAGVSTLQVPQNRDYYSVPGSLKRPLRPSTSSTYTRKENLLKAKSLMETFERPSTGSGAGGRTRNGEMAAAELEAQSLRIQELEKELKLAKVKAAEAAAALTTADGESPETRTPPSGLLGTLGRAIDEENQSSSLGDAVALSPIKLKKGDPIIAETASAEILDSLNKSASSPAILTIPKRKGSKSKTSTDRFDEKRPNSSALGKLGISNTAGTSTKLKQKKGNNPKAELMFGRKRLKSIRTLRDQMMSIAGGMTAFARADDPEQSKLFDAKASIMLNKTMAKQTMDKNRHDSTWEILETPGYLEQVGPDAVFRSDSHTNYQADERYAKAIDPVDFDHTNGIPPSPLRIWAEDAVKSGRLPLFTSGGAFRV